MDEKQLQALYNEMNHKLDLGTYGDFKSRIYTDANFRKAFHTEASHDLDVGDFQSFDNQFKKKELSASGLSNTTLPSQTTNQIDENDIISQAVKADELSKKQIEVNAGNDELSGAQLTTFQPDENAIEQSKQIKKSLAGKGYSADDVNDLANDFKDFPELDEKYFSEGTKAVKDKLLALRKTNPIDYKSQVAYNKNVGLLFKHGGFEAAKQYDRLSQEPQQNVGQLMDNIQHKQSLIANSLDGEEKDAALQNLKQETQRFFNPQILQQDFESNHPELKDKIDLTQYAGLKTLEAFDPKAAEDMYKIVQTGITPMYTHQLPLDVAKNIQAPVAISTSYESVDSSGGRISQTTVDEQIGKESALRKLSEIGRYNTSLSLNDEQYKLNAAYENEQDPQKKEQIKLRYLQNQSQINQLKNDEREDDKKYPLTADLKFDNQVKELLQNPATSVVNYGVTRFAEGVDAPRQTFENIFTGVFGSEESKTLLRMRKIGEHYTMESLMYLPSDYQSKESPYKLKFSSELEGMIDTVEKDGSLTRWQKDAKEKDIMSRYQGDIETITNPDAGKSKNFFSKATAYKTSGFIGDLTAMAMQQHLLGKLGFGKAMSNGLPLFFDTQNQFYREALANGEKNPEGYANLHAIVMGLAGMINPQLGIVKRAVGLNTELGKVVQGIDEATWDAIVNKNKPLVTKFANSITSATREAGKIGAVWGVGVSIANDVVDEAFLNKDKGNILENAATATKDAIVDFLPMLLLNAVTHFKAVPIEQKALLWEVGDNPDIGKLKIDEALQNGEIKPVQAEQRKKVIDEISSLIKKVPKENKKGEPLTDKQRLNYLFNLYFKEKSSEIEGTKTEESIKQADEENKNILSGNETNPQQPADTAESKDVGKTFTEPLTYEQKYSETEFKDPIDMTDKKATVRTMRGKVEKAFNTLEKLVNCITTNG